MVPWAFSCPGDLNFDAFSFASSSGVLGSNRKAVVKRLGSSTRRYSSCWVSVVAAAAAGVVAALAWGLASVIDWRVEKVADSW